MRKFTLLLAMVAFASFSFAQGNFKPVKASLSKAEPVQKVVKAPVQQRDPGDIIWEHDFNGDLWSGTSDNGSPVPANVPAGWNLTDETGNGYYWRWDTVGPRGMFVSDNYNTECQVPLEPLESTTAENGFIMFESSYYNTPGDCSDYFEEVMDGAVVYTDGIDFSGYLSIKLRFTQWNRFCCAFSTTDDAWFEASTDGGTTWSQKSVSIADVNVGVDNDGEYSEFDVTSMVSGYANVQFRFRQSGLSHYHWLIDDVQFVESMNHDIYLLDYWNNYIEDNEEAVANTNDFVEGFYYYPWFMIQSFESFTSEFLNYGNLEQTNVTQNIEITRNGAVVELFTDASLASLALGATDTLKSSSAFMPEGKGKYVISHYMTADNADEITSNDTISRTFVVGDNMLAPVDYKTRTSSLSPDNWTSYAAGTGMAFTVNIPETSLHGDGVSDYYEVKGIEVYVTSQRYYADQLALFQNEEASFIPELYKDNGDETYTLVLSGSERILTIADTSSYVYVPFEANGSQYIIEGGAYVVNLVFNGNWTDPFGRIQSFDIGENDEFKPAAGYINTMAAGGSDLGWVTAGPCMALDVTFSDPYPETEYDAHFLVDDGRAPVENARIKVAQHDVRTDVNGEATVTLENGVYPYIITYDDITINGSFSVDGADVTVGISGSIFAEFNIYPNPSNGVFTVKIEGQANLTVVNLAGQVVDTRTITGTQVVNLDVESGMYFVSVKIGDNVATKQLIVR